MSKFRKKGEKETPEMSTAALPDIIFMLLFFFMVATTVKDDNHSDYLDITLTKASEAKEIKRKDLMSYMYIGKPTEKYAAQFGVEPMLLINDQLVPKNQYGLVIQKYIEEHRKNVPIEDFGNIITQLTVDNDTPLGFVQNIKKYLSYNRAFKVSYVAETTEDLEEGKQ